MEGGGFFLFKLYSVFLINGFKYWFKFVFFLFMTTQEVFWVAELSRRGTASAGELDVLLR